MKVTVTGKASEETKANLWVILILAEAKKDGLLKNVG